MSPVLLRAMAGFAAAVLILAVAPASGESGASLVRNCAFDFCPPSLPGPLTAWPWVEGTRYLRLASTHIELMNPNGTAVWSVAMHSAQLPDLVAEGDFTGSGVPGYVFEEVRPAAPAQSCAGHPMSESQLVFVDGRTGASWRPLDPTPDVCWTNLGYATHQWGIGTAYIGPFIPGRAGNQVLLFPYYASAGYVLSFQRRMGWRFEKGVVDRLPFPSTPAYDDAYNAANSSPCLGLPGHSECYVENSHVANAVFLSGQDPSTAGLFVLTSDRALIYRPDFTPTSDLVWNYAEGGGRNYGLVESHLVDGEQLVTLVGGCSVAKTHDTMRTGRLSDDPCGLHHHYEFFVVQGQQIVQHDGRFYGWSGTDGLWQNRLEFPFPSVIPLADGHLWSVFNLYRDGEWRAQLLPDAADPASVIEESGWYVWGSVTSRSGRTYLAATRTAATDSTSVASYIPPWQFDLLSWRDGGLVSVAHFAGVVPSLALAPPGPSYHASDGDPFGLVVNPSSRCGPDDLLVESKDARQSYVPIPDRDGVC